MLLLNSTTQHATAELPAHQTYRGESFLLNGISFVVRSFVRWCPPFLFFCTVLPNSVQFCCTCAVREQIESWARAEEGTGTTGKGRRVRGHLEVAIKYEHRPTATAFRSKIIAPEPRIARAPELVLYKRRISNSRRLKTTGRFLKPSSTWPFYFSQTRKN